MKKKIVILGNSVGVPTLIEAIRNQDQESDIALVSPDGQLPYDRSALAKFVAKEATAAQVLLKPTDFYSKNKVQTILDKKVTKINFRRGQVVLEEKELVLDFDILIVSSLPDRKMPDIKGVNKTGLYALDQCGAVSAFVKELPFVQTIIVQSNSPFAAEMAEAIKKREKETILISDSAPALSEGITLIANNPIVEILGETDTRAIKLKSGKVIACDAVFFGELKPHFRLFQDSPVDVNDRITVDANFKTTQGNIFAFDEAIQGASVNDAQEGEAYVQKVIEQAKTIASQIAGNKTEAPAQPQLSENA